MIRCCPKFFNPLQSNCGGTVCLSRVYVASSSIDCNQRRYASGENQPPRRFKKLFYTSVGITLLGVGGVVVYAKSDPKFRKVLDSYVPGSDKFIRIIYQEEGSFSVDIPELSTIQDKLLSIPSDIYKQISGTTDEKPSSVLPKVKELTSEEITKAKPKPSGKAWPATKKLKEEEKLVTDIKPSPSTKESKVEEKVVTDIKYAVDTSRKAINVVEVSGTDLKSIVEEATNIYHELINTITGKSDELLELIDKLDDAVDPKKSWKEIRAKMDEFTKFGQEVDSKLKDAGDKFKKFQTLMKKGGPPDNDVKELESKLISAKEQAEQLKNNKLDGATKYLTKVEEALKQTNDELMTLFPNYHPGSKNLRLTEDELDLFMYYSLHKILYYQKEISKMDAIIKQKLEQVMKKKENGAQLTEMVNIKVDEEKRKIKEDFDKKMLEMKKGCDDEVHNSLKRQEQVHMDLLNDQLALKEKEVERKLSQIMETKLVEEEAKLQAELAEMTGRMQGLNEAIAKRALQDQKAQTSQALWSAAQALFDSLKHGNGDKIKPLKELVQAIKNSSAKGDDLVETVLATIPKVAVERGVYPEDVLKERFIKVEESAWRVAGVPEGGASLPKLLMAWLQSHLVIRASEPIPSAELNNEPFDPNSLNNYDILQRARYYVDRGDLEQALKYMNLLKGGARAISSDWIKETIVLLETEQAAHLLLAHASASGMIYS